MRTRILTPALVGLAVALLCTSRASADPPASPADLARKAEAVLKAHCYRCHGQDGAVEGGMNYILDRDKLVARRKIVPGKADDSAIIKKIVAKAMPPAEAPSRPNDEELQALRDWINNGAPAATPAPPRTLVTDAKLFEWMLEDLDKQEPRSRRFIRYFSLAPLANAGAGPDELTTYRHALSKLINSLSWHPRITLPQPVDKEGILLRIDLRDYQWDANLWNRLVSEYPYGILQDTAVARAVVVFTASRMPFVRADWFVANASRPPLYYDLLQIPTSLNELERQLRVDVTLDIQQERVARAGFNGSGISKNNRVLERHDAMNGAYWRTYDFDAVPQNLTERDLLLPDRRNLFAYPLGPSLGENSFQHAGGEAIFNLPNGLQGYMLVNANNVRIDKGPVAIVSDPKRPDRAVEAGISCMNCHNVGILQKDDQIRAHVQKNAKAFPRKDAEVIQALYVPAEKMRKLMQEDQERFKKAVEKTGNKVGVAEVVMSMTLRYEADVDLQTLAAEVALKPEELLALIPTSENLNRNLGPLKVSGGIVSRQVVVQAFADLGKALRQGVVLLPGQLGQILPDNTGEVDPLEAQSSPGNAIAFSPDGKLAAIASADKSVRVYDVDAGRDVKRLIGHTASVWAVAFSHDGKRIASAGKDAVIRIWDVESGLELKRLEGHTDLVTSVAFLYGGKQLLSAGLDHQVILWDLDRAEATKTWDKWKFINAVAPTPNNQWFAVAAQNNIYLIDATGAQKPALLAGHAGWVTGFAFSVDSKQLFSAGDDGTVRQWDLEKREPVRTFTGHQGGVKAVALDRAARTLVTAGTDATVRLWELKSGQEQKVWRKHAEPLVAVTFVGKGNDTLSGDKGGNVLAWVPYKTTPPEANPNPMTGNPDPPVVGGPAKELRPVKVLPIGGTVGALRFDPKRQALYYLNLTDNKVGGYDLAKGRFYKEIAVAEGTDTLVLPPDGAALYATASVPGGKARGVVQVLDPATLKVTSRFEIDAAPYDLAATDAGLLFLTGRDGDWSEVVVVDAAKKQIAARWGGVWNKSFLQLEPDLKRVLYSSQGVKPGTLEALVIPEKFADKPAVFKAPAPAQGALGGEFFVTPDGKFALFKNGTVVKLAPGTDRDLTVHLTLPPFAAAVVDEEGKWLWTMTADGVMEKYSYPDFRKAAAWKTGVTPYHMTVDPTNGKLYVAGFDPQEVAARPRARGFGDVFVFEIK